MYVKLFQKILDSTINETAVTTRWTWITCLVLADTDGYFTATPRAIAAHANLPLDDVLAALETLQAPDPNSTTPDDEGRRLKKVGPNSWLVTNKRRYREIASREDQRAYDRHYSEERRKSAKLQTVGDSRRQSELIGSNRKNRTEEEEEEEKEDLPPKSPRSKTGHTAPATIVKKVESMMGIGTKPQATTPAQEERNQGFKAWNELMRLCTIQDGAVLTSTYRPIRLRGGTLEIGTRKGATITPLVTTLTGIANADVAKGRVEGVRSLKVMEV